MTTPEATSRTESGEEVTGPLRGHELRRRAVSGVLAIGLRSVAVRVMGLLANVVLARQLTPDDFGMAAFGLSIVAVGAFFTGGGIGAALVRQEEEPTPLQLEAVFGTQLAAALVVSVIALAIGLPLGGAGALTAVMVLSLPLDVLRAPAAILVQRELRFGPIVRAEVSEMVAYNVLAIVLVLLGVGVWSIAIASVARAGVGSMLLIALSGEGLHRPRLSLPTIRPMLGFGLALQGVQGVSLGRDQALNSSTIAVAGTAVLGQWSFSYRLLQPLVLVFDAVEAVAFPAVSGLIRAGEDPRPLVEKGIRLAFGMTGVGVVVVASATPAAVPSIFGHQWTPAIAAVPWSLMGIFVSQPIRACAQAYLGAIGQAGVVFRSQLYYTAAWVVVTVPLLASLDAVALGVGWVAAGLVEAAYLIRALRRHIDAHVLRNAGPAVALALVAAPLGWLVEAWLGATVPVAALAGALGGVTYLLALRVVQPQLARELGEVARRFARRSGG